MKLHKIALSILTITTTISTASAVEITDINKWDKCRDKAESSVDIHELGVTGVEMAIEEQCGKPPAIEPSSVAGTVGMHPSDVLRSKMWKDKFIAISKNQYAELVERIDVASKTTREGDWIVGDGCKPHSCSWDNAIIGINTKNNQVFAIMWSDGKTLEKFGAVPAINTHPRIKKWLSDKH